MGRLAGGPDARVNRSKILLASFSDPRWSARLREVPLDPSERARAERLAPDLRTDYCRRRRFVRWAAAGKLGLSYDAVVWRTDDAGRKRLGPDVWASWSASRDTVALVLDERPVGIDLVGETVDEVLLRRTLGEVASGLSARDLWAAKEALYKASACRGGFAPEAWCAARLAAHWRFVVPGAPGFSLVVAESAD